jgi:hypothetical protein
MFVVVVAYQTTDAHPHKASLPPQKRAHLFSSRRFCARTR